MKIIFLCDECKTSCRLVNDREYEEENPASDAPSVCPFGLFVSTDELPIETKAKWIIENPLCNSCAGTGTVWFREDSGFYHHGGGKAFIDADAPCSECDGTGYTNQEHDNA